MRTRRTTVSVALATGAVALAALAPPATAAHEGLEVTGLTQSKRLVTFLADEPGEILSSVRVSGVAGRIIGIDYRPSTGALYAVGNEDGVGTLYVVDPLTGVATAVPGAATLTLVGEDFGVDFNPVPDRLRIVSDAGQNLRVNVDTGASIVDGALRYADGGGTPSVVGAAYTNNDNNPTTGTTLYDVDTLRDALFTQAPPNDGVLGNQVPLGETGTDVGFDVYSELAGTGAARSNVALLSNRVGGTTTLSVVRLMPTAAGPAGVVATSTEVIGSRPPVVDIAVDPRQ